MANTITTTYKINGSRYFTAEIDIIGDGSGEATNVTLIDPASLTGTPADFTIRAIQWGTDGSFNAQFLWDATTKEHAFEISLAAGGIRFSDTGAHLKNNSGAGKTGKLLLTTVGLNATSRGTIVIEGHHE